MTVIYSCQIVNTAAYLFFIPFPFPSISLPCFFLFFCSSLSPLPAVMPLFLTCMLQICPFCFFLFLSSSHYLFLSSFILLLGFFHHPPSLVFSHLFPSPLCSFLLYVFLYAFKISHLSFLSSFPTFSYLISHTMSLSYLP